MNLQTLSKYVLKLSNTYSTIIRETTKHCKCTSKFFLPVYSCDAFNFCHFLIGMET